MQMEKYKQFSLQDLYYITYIIKTRSLSKIYRSFNLDCLIV